MRFNQLWIALFTATIVCAQRVLEATSLVPCMENSLFTASQFNVRFTPSNRTVSYDIVSTSEIDGYVTGYIDVYAYGIKIISETIDACSLNLKPLCPLSPGEIDINANTQVSSDVVSDIPGIAYNMPDIDALVIIRVADENDNLLACIQADFGNRKTVDLTAVKWVTAVIAGIGLLTSAVVSTLGNSYSAAHIAANAVSLFGYFQSVVIITMIAVDRVPPIASSWAQNLVWSVGLIRVTFMQNIFRWYVQATGGDPTTDISFPTIAVLVQKRLSNAVGYATEVVQKRAATVAELYRRAPAVQRYYSRSTPAINGTITLIPQSSDTLEVVRGIDRVARDAGIEQTSVVLTTFTFFFLICLAVAICFGIFRGIVQLFFQKPQKSEYDQDSVLDVPPTQRTKFSHFRTHWMSMLKGTILRLTFIAFPQLAIFSLWEFIQRDSTAVIVLAVFFLLVSGGVLAWTAVKVFILGIKSQREFNTPAYLLFSDANTFNRYGSLYIPFKANAFYFVLPILIYTLVKACFVAFAQSSGKTQAMALFIIELAYMAFICWKKPFMDKRTNVINIIICVVNTLNSIFFLFFSNLFGQPQYVNGVMGLVFFILNAAFSLILMVYILVTCLIVLLSKNPDSRYKPAKDDRASFIQDQDSVTNNAAGELTALGAAVRAGHDDIVVDRSPNLGLSDASSVSSATATGKNPFSEKSGPQFDDMSAVDSFTDAEAQGGHVRTDSTAMLEDKEVPSRWRLFQKKN